MRKNHFSNKKEDLDSAFTSNILRNAQKESDLKKSQKQRNNADFSEKNSFVNSLEEIQFLKAYFEALKKGGPKEIEFIKKALKNDPRRNARGPKDDTRRGNLPYLNGEFPLYVACKYNHLKIIKILLQGTLPLPESLTKRGNKPPKNLRNKKQRLHN